MTPRLVPEALVKTDAQFIVAITRVPLYSFFFFWFLILHAGSLTPGTTIVDTQTT